MEHVTLSVSELSGAALDWAVARCEGRRVEFNHQYTEETKFDGWWQLGPNHWQPLNKYSTDWAQGGPIIERERITVWGDNPFWEAERGSVWCNGPTPLIAAMRCYVVSKLGDKIDVPLPLIG